MRQSPSMSAADKHAGNLCLFLCVFLFLAICGMLTRCTQRPIPVTLFPDVTETPALVQDRQMLDHHKMTLREQQEPKVTLHP